MTKSEVIEKLDELSISYEADAKKADLEALLPVEENDLIGKAVGTAIITGVREVEINGKFVKELSLSDGTTTIMSSEVIEELVS